MNTLFTSIHPISLHPQFLQPLPPPTVKFRPKPITCHVTPPSTPHEIDMIKSPSGTFTSKPPKVVILWDLDNKPPRGPPYPAALSLKALASSFGHVIDFSAYANRHAFIHLPNWVISQRRDQRRLNHLEKSGLSSPPSPYLCSVCGRKFPTNLDLKKHFRNLHEREREKKLNRMRGLKGKKREKFKKRFIDGNEKYNEAARRLVVPKVGYGLAGELRRAGVFVKTVEDKPQAADWALKRQMEHSMSRGVDWLVLVSDDSDFVEMVRRAREGSLGTVVVGDWDRALGREADFWVEWGRVENGEVTEEDLLAMRRRGERGEFSVSEFGGSGDGVGELDDVIDELVGGTKFDRMRTSAFSEGDEDDDDWLRINERSDQEDTERGFLSDSDNEDDVYFI